MERSEKELLKAAAKAELERVIEKARQRYRETVAGIDAVDRLKKGLAKSGKRRGRAKGSLDDSKLTAGILRLLPSLPDTFTLNDVKSQLNDPEANRDSIATAIRRLAEEERGLETVVAGRGRRQAVYRKLVS